MATVLTDKTRFVLDEERIPRAWYNIAADLPSPPPPPLHPGTGQPIGPDDLAPLFPMELIKQVVSQDREIEIPDPVRDAYKLYRPSPAPPGASAGEGARDPRPHLLQVRGRQPVGQPQAEHRARPGVLQQERGRDPARDRDRRRAVGERARLRRRGLRPRGQGLHGPRELRPEAVPPEPDGDLRRADRRVSVARHRVRPQASSPRRPATRAPSGIAISEAIEDTVTHPGTKYSLGLGVRLRPAPPDGDRPGVDRADGDGRRGAGRDHRLRRRRLELRRADLPVARPDVPRRAQVPRDRGRARGRAVADPRHLRLRLRRHRRR